jgi:hypothetical protein
MNNTTPQLIHAAVELVVGAGITFWLNRKISALSQKVGVLEDKLKFYENMVGQHHELIKKLFTLIESGSLGAVKIPQAPPAPFKTPETPAPTLLDSSPPLEVPQEIVADVAADTQALDAILSNEIRDIKIDRTASLT